jgi:hypothetical protein
MSRSPAFNPHGSPQALIDNLKALGLPEEQAKRQARLIALGQMVERNAARLRNQPYQSEYWRSGDTESWIQARRESIEENRRWEQAYFEAFGEAPPQADSWRRDAGLPPEKERAARWIAEDYQLLMAEIRRRGEPMLPEDRELLEMLERERREDLAALLSPEEQFEYALRHSDTANRLRRQLRYFDLTESEFREMVRLRLPLDEEVPRSGLSNDEQALRRQAEAQVNQAMERALGPDRYREMQRASDGRFQAIASITDRVGLPRENASQAFDIARRAQRQEDQLRRNRETTAAQRLEQQRQLLTETGQQLRSLLGDRGYQAYVESQGQWLRSLETQVARADRPRP